MQCNWAIAMQTFTFAGTISVGRVKKYMEPASAVDVISYLWKGRRERETFLVVYEFI